ncbi:MAG TPA: cytochrome c [Trueperaceae bacterium]|nr:cytochrome c [Trueperaceae bacterium]
MRQLIFTLIIVFPISLAQQTGQEIYQKLCTVCHQENALGSVAESGLFSGNNFHETRVESKGLVAAFPPLANNITKTYELTNGRQYLMSVLLFGLVGKINIDQQSYDGIMPAWANLSDQELANVLNYVLANWSDKKDFDYKATEFAALRQEARDSEYNCQARAQLGLNCELSKRSE